MLEFVGVFERWGEFYQECIVFSLYVFGNIEAVWDEHIVGLGDELFVEPYLCDGVEAFGDEVDARDIEKRFWDRECFFEYPGFLTDPVEFFGIGIEVGRVDSAGLNQAGEN